MPPPPPPKAQQGPPPDARSLHDAAVRHLARYSATQVGLLRVLGRRIDRWARAAEAAPEIVATAQQAARDVVAKLAAVGAVDDAAFAARRARSLARAGRSRRAIGAHLAARGVSAELTAALPYDPEAELTAALAYARRRRMGPFRQPPDPEQHMRDMGRLARAGFPQNIASAVLRMDADDAEERVIAARLS
jgi:regulatory protein